MFGHMDWSSKIKRAVVVDKAGGHYTIETALPWSSFVSPRSPAPPHPGDVWRMNFYSFRDGQRAALAWSPIRKQGNFHKSSRFGQVTFVAEGAEASASASALPAMSAHPPQMAMPLVKGVTAE